MSINLPESQTPDFDQLGSAAGAPVLGIDDYAIIHVGEAVIRSTKELFGGRVSLKVMSDPEANSSLVVVTVEAHGQADDLADKSDSWHRNLHEAAKDFTNRFALSIVPLDDAT